MCFVAANGLASGFGVKLKPWQRFVAVAVAVAAGVEFGLEFEESERG